MPRAEDMLSQKRIHSRLWAIRIFETMHNWRPFHFAGGSFTEKFIEERFGVNSDK